MFLLLYALQKCHILPSPCSWSRRHALDLCPFRPSSSPLVATGLFSVSACLFLFIWFVRLFCCCCSFFATYNICLSPVDISCVRAQALRCPTLWDPMDCSPPGSSVNGIFQARILERVAISFLLPDPGIEPMAPAFQVDSLPLSHWGNPFGPLLCSCSFKLASS